MNISENNFIEHAPIFSRKTIVKRRNKMTFRRFVKKH